MANRASKRNQGGPRDVESLYVQYAGWLRSRAVSRFGTQEADDLIQEAWLRLLPDRDMQVEHPKAFLWRILNNVAVDQIRRRARWGKGMEQAAFLSTWPDQASAQLDGVYLREVVLGLPQPLRDVFVLKRFGGLTNAQVAEQLGISPKTVEWRMTKALAHCAAQLRA